jgi:glutamate synthase domain-containing protein 2
MSERANWRCNERAPSRGSCESLTHGFLPAAILRRREALFNPGQRSTGMRVCAAFLGSDDASFATGQMIACYGSP